MAMIAYTSINKDMSDYFSGIQEKLSPGAVKSEDIVKIVENYPLTRDQCLYVYDWCTNTVLIQKRVNELLGYDKKEFSILFKYENIHPDDRQIVMMVTQLGVNYVYKHKLKPFDLTASINYRVKKKNGKYIRAFRQSSVLSVDKQGNMTTNLTVLTDVSQMDTSKQVLWKIEAPGAEREKFEQIIKKELQKCFTERETEILQLLRNGLTSSEIAEKLYISKHTVKTHRKNMLRKAGCSNLPQLLEFGFQHGIINI